MNFPNPLPNTKELYRRFNQLLAAAKASRVKQGLGYMVDIGPDGTHLKIERTGSQKKKDELDTLVLGFDNRVTSIATNISTGRSYAVGEYGFASQDDFATKVRRSAIVAITDDFDLDVRDWYLYYEVFGLPVNPQMGACAVHSSSKKIITVGNFIEANHQSPTFTIGLLVLNDDGTVQALNGDVSGDLESISINQASAKAYVASAVVTVGADTYEGVVRFELTGGAVDTGFNSINGQGTGIECVVVIDPTDAHSKVAFGSSSPGSSWKGTAYHNCCLLLDEFGAIDGGWDTTKICDGGVEAIVYSGGVVIGGDFTTYDGTSRHGIARITLGGLLDAGFDPGTGFNNIVFALAVQGNKILAGGTFTTFNGVSKNRLLRLNADGSIDNTFTNNAISDSVNTICVEASGTILIGGDFLTVAGKNRKRIARLSADGVLLGE